MSRNTILARVARIALPSIIGASAALALAPCGGARSLAAEALSPHREVSEHVMSVSSTEAYTVFLPALFRCCDAQTPPFGVQFYGALNSDSGLAEIADAGATWIRMPISWRTIEPTNTRPEYYSWSALDASVSNAAERGVELILTLAGQPSWAAAYEQGPVTNTQDLVEFFSALVERYDGDGVDDAPGSPTVTHFELYNEPDNGSLGHAAHGGWGCWGDFDDDVPGCGDAEDYAALLQLLYPVVKQANPRAKLVFGGIALDAYAPAGPFDPHFLDNVLAACEGQDCFDVMNFHYYPPFRQNWEPYGTGMIGKANYVRERLAAHGRPDVPVICTETSWDSEASWGSEELQSRYVVKAYVRGMAADLDVVTWFWARDGDAGGAPGLLDDSLQPRDSYTAFGTMTEMLKGALYQRSLTLAETGDERIEGYVFQTSSGRMDVVWTEDDTPYITDDDPFLPYIVEARAVRVVHRSGCAMEYRDEGDGVIDGKILIQVEGSPLFVEYNP